MAIRINCGRPERNEVAALNRLTADLSDDWALFTNLPRHLTGMGPRGREIDALALSPLGAVVIELKHFGGLIMVNPVGEWLVADKPLIDPRGHPQYPLQQAGKAAQILKSALGEQARSVYIEACAVATRDSAKIQFADPSRPQAVMSLNDAALRIEALARRTRGIPNPVLHAIFQLVGHEIPPKLSVKWRSSASASSAARSEAAGGFSRRDQMTGRRGVRHYRPKKQGKLPLWWILTAVIAGSFIGFYILAKTG